MCYVSAIGVFLVHHRRLAGLLYFISSGIARCLVEFSRSRRDVRIYLFIARGSRQRPSIIIVCRFVFVRALSVAQPARLLWGRILRGISEPGGSKAANVDCSQRVKVLRLSGRRARCGNKRACPGAFIRSVASKYQVMILPADVKVEPHSRRSCGLS